MGRHNSTGTGEKEAKRASSTLTAEPPKPSRRNTRTASRATDLDTIQVALTVFQQSAANLQRAIEQAGDKSGLTIKTAYLPSSNGVAIALIGFFYCPRCHWFSIGARCSHCSS